MKEFTCLTVVKVVENGPHKYEGITCGMVMNCPPPDPNHVLTNSCPKCKEKTFKMYRCPACGEDHFICHNCDFHKTLSVIMEEWKNDHRR